MMLEKISDALLIGWIVGVCSGVIFVLGVLVVVSVCGFFNS